MQIRVKLLGILRDRTPPDGKLDLSDGATLADALSAFNIPASQVYLALLNGEPQVDASRQLHADDELIVTPPVAGG